MSSRRSAAVVQRYQDAYRVGNAIVGIGSIIKAVGFVLAGLIVVVSLLGGAAVGSQSGAAGFASILTGAIAAGIVGLLFWLAGVLISSQGQLLLATLDNAVNHSPFISDDERAVAMALPDATPIAGASSAGASAADATDSSGATGQGRPQIQPGERTITCPQCGVVNRASAFYCESCKRNLHI